jgi:hypothetical protein
MTLSSRVARRRMLGTTAPRRAIVPEPLVYFIGQQPKPVTAREVEQAQLLGPGGDPAEWI